MFKNFLKRIFEREETVSEEEVKKEELKDWFEERLSRIDFKEEVLEFFNKLKDKRWQLGEKIERLEEAGIEEKEKERVEEKIKNVVLGHKDNYVKEMRRFVESWKLPEGNELREAIRFSESLNKSLDELAGRTAKSYAAAQHLFFKPVEEVFKVIGEINRLAKGFDGKLERKGFKKLGLVEEKIRLILEGEKRRSRLEEELGWKEDKRKRCRLGKEKQEKEMERLSGSEEYEEFKALKEKEAEIRNLGQENRDEVFLFFSKLGRALRKYEKVTMEVKIVQEYLADGVGAFFKDKELKIEGVLEGLGRSMEKGEIELDEKQKEKVRELVKRGREGYLRELKERQKEREKKAAEMEAKLRRYNIDQLIEEAEYKREHFEEQMVLVEREIEEVKVKLGVLGGEKLVGELKELVKEVLKAEVKVVGDGNKNSS